MERKPTLEERVVGGAAIACAFTATLVTNVAVGETQLTFTRSSRALVVQQTAATADAPTKMFE